MQNIWIALWLHNRDVRSFDRIEHPIILSILQLVGETSTTILVVGETIFPLKFLEPLRKYQLTPHSKVFDCAAMIPLRLAAQANPIIITQNFTYAVNGTNHFIAQNLRAKFNTFNEVWDRYICWALSICDTIKNGKWDIGEKKHKKKPR